MSIDEKRGRQLQQRVSAFMNKFHMINPGEKVIIALSGGADSVCLFHMLLKMRETMGFCVEAVHVNHMLREAAPRDEKFVKELCERKEVPLHILRADVEAVAKQKKQALEEAGRDIRYDYFAKTAKQTGAQKIAVAHHANDQAETILFHLCRGSGIEGLGGIRPVRDDIIRPLLCLSREEIEEYLSYIGEAYVTDETNQQNVYSRNRIRNEIIPMLERQLCTETVSHMAHTGEVVWQACDFIQQQLEKAIEECVSEDGVRLRLELTPFAALHPYLQGEVLRESIIRFAGQKKDIAAVHVDALRNLKDLQVGSRCQLPYGIEVQKSYESLIFSKGMPKEETFCVEIQTIALERTWQLQKQTEKTGEQMQTQSEDAVISVNLPDGKVLRMQVMDYDPNRAIPTNIYTKWLDYDKMEEPLMIRTTREGDFFYFNDKNRKFVKDYMVNEKIPQAERAGSILVASGNHMAYFVGKRISNYFKTDQNTKRVLVIDVLE